jgi:deazaflavin-dependent oxidoreductase (nitroreductase family)
MWLMNKIGAPLVSLILRSRFHRWMSATVLLITYRGRKSGKEITLPVNYAQDGQYVYIVSGMPEKKSWWRNFREKTPVQLTLRGKVLSGSGVLLDPVTQAEEIVTGITVKLNQFPSLASSYHIRTTPDGGWDPADLKQAAQNLVMIRVELKKS